jgi:DNA-binding MarR family transcriptional regulator
MVDYMAPRTTAPQTPPTLPRPLADRVGYLVARSHHLVGDLAEQALEPVGLLDADCTPKHVGCLTMIAEESPLSQHELGELMAVDRTTIVAIVDRLEDAGYVERRRNPDDRRAYALEITPAGRKWLEQARRAVFEAEQKFLEPLSRAERRQLTGMLQRLLVGRLG